MAQTAAVASNRRFSPSKLIPHLLPLRIPYRSNLYRIRGITCRQGSSRLLTGERVPIIPVPPLSTKPALDIGGHGAIKGKEHTNMAKLNKAGHASCDWQRQSQVEALADNDRLFRENYRALVCSGTLEPVRSNVQAWLVRSSYARQRRHEQQQAQFRQGGARAGVEHRSAVEGRIMKTIQIDVMVDHTYSPISVRAYDLGESTGPIERGILTATVPLVDGQQGVFGTGTVTIPSGTINVDICQNGWATVAAGGCDVEWREGPEIWQARIVDGQINGFKVAARGKMSHTK